MKGKLSSLTRASTSLRLKQDDLANLSILGTPLQILGGKKIKINDDVYDLSPETHKALSSTSYTGKFMRDEENLRTLYNILKDVGYTGIGDRSSKHEKIYKTSPIG